MRVCNKHKMVGSITKKVLRMMCTFLVFVFCVLQFSTDASAATIRNKKVVSVVYDDSGSMNTDNPPKWAYANYAMQSFAGMMNKEDALYISYMSNVSRNKVETINLNDKNSSVKTIREHAGSGGTPFKAVEMAYETLNNHQDSNVNTQYWLVIMTDGQFGEKAMPEVESRLCEIADSTMPNGTSPKIIFLSMCDTGGTYTPKDNLRSNITVKTSEKATDITDTIAEIADEISGRYTVNESDITLVDDKTVKVTSKLPLLNIGVLTQYSTASVTKVEFNDELNGVIESNVALKYPEISNRTTDTSLIGNVALLNNGSDNIPSGTYIIHFSESITRENLKILFEPALELRLTLSREDVIIKDVTQIPADAVLEATATLYEAGTDNKIDLKLLPSGIKQTISHLENGQVVKSIDGSKLTDIMLSPNPTVIEATFELEGYFNLYQSYSFDPLDVVVSGIKAELYYDGSKRRNGDPENVVYTDTLKDNKTGIRFTLFVDGVQVDKMMATHLFPRFEAGLDTELTPIETEILNDGTIVVYPTKGAYHINWIYWLKYGGTQKITANLDGISAYGDLVIKPGIISLIIEVWILVIILRILMQFFFRKKFNGVEVKAYNLTVEGMIIGNPFRNCASQTTVLKHFDRGLMGLFMIILPIPLLGLLLLLPARKKIGGTKYVAVATSVKGYGFKITGLGGRSYMRGQCVSSLDLPKPNVVTDKNKKKKDVIDVSGETDIVICESANTYVKLTFKVLNKTNRRKKNGK